MNKLTRFWPHLATFGRQLRWTLTSYWAFQWPSIMFCFLLGLVGFITFAGKMQTSDTLEVLLPDRPIADRFSDYSDLPYGGDLSKADLCDLLAIRLPRIDKIRICNRELEQAWMYVVSDERVQLWSRSFHHLQGMKIEGDVSPQLFETLSRCPTLHTLIIRDNEATVVPAVKTFQELLSLETLLFDAETAANILSRKKMIAQLADVTELRTLYVGRETQADYERIAQIQQGLPQVQVWPAIFSYHVSAVWFMSILLGLGQSYILRVILAQFGGFWRGLWPRFMPVHAVAAIIALGCLWFAGKWVLLAGGVNPSLARLIPLIFLLAIFSLALRRLRHPQLVLDPAIIGGAALLLAMLCLAGSPWWFDLPFVSMLRLAMVVIGGILIWQLVTLPQDQSAAFAEPSEKGASVAPRWIAAVSAVPEFVKIAASESLHIPYQQLSSHAKRARWRLGSRPLPYSLEMMGLAVFVVALLGLELVAIILWLGDRNNANAPWTWNSLEVILVCAPIVTLLGVGGLYLSIYVSTWQERKRVWPLEALFPETHRNRQGIWLRDLLLYPLPMLLAIFTADWLISCWLSFEHSRFQLSYSDVIGLLALNLAGWSLAACLGLTRLQPDNSAQRLGTLAPYVLGGFVGIPVGTVWLVERSGEPFIQRNLAWIVLAIWLVWTLGFLLNLAFGWLRRREFDVR